MVACCRIPPISARIDAEDAAIVPDRFTLLLSGNGKARRTCRVVWRRPRQIGVKFEPRAAGCEKEMVVPVIDPSSSAGLKPEIT